MSKPKDPKTKFSKAQTITVRADRKGFMRGAIVLPGVVFEMDIWSEYEKPKWCTVISSKEQVHIKPVTPSGVSEDAHQQYLNDIGGRNAPMAHSQVGTGVEIKGSYDPAVAPETPVVNG